MSKHYEEVRRKVYDAIFLRIVPDCALSWPVIETVLTHPIRGGGESTTWASAFTIRLDGKQWGRKVSDRKNQGNTELPERLAKVYSRDGRTVYVQFPPFIP